MVQIRILGSSDLVGSVRSPRLVVSVFLHISFSKSLPLFWVTIHAYNILDGKGDIIILV